MLSQVMFPMSMLHELLTADQIANYSKFYNFDESDPFFHFDHDEEFLESCDMDSIEWYNDGMDDEDMLVLYDELAEELRTDYMPH